jgi:formamidopyrimidine-DNA glycosylase
MPELPEVETIARTLRDGTNEQPGVVGKRITTVQVEWPGIVAWPDASSFQALALGQTIKSVGRRGKYLVLGLTDDTLLIHLRMSGDIHVTPIDQTPANHIRVWFGLDRDWKLSFNNPRKFGRVWLLEDPAVELGKLGPEPLDPTLNGAVLHAMLQSRKRQIKPLLLDQTFLAGVGNIYADEALNLAGIHPLTRANQITGAQAKALLAALRSVLEEGIRRNGASIDWVYRGGEFQNYFRVYDRAGKPCPTCGTPVVRIVVGQRGTHLCPACQRAAREV